MLYIYLYLIGTTKYLCVYLVSSFFWPKILHIAQRPTKDGHSLSIITHSSLQSTKNEQFFTLTFLAQRGLLKNLIYDGPSSASPLAPMAHRYGLCLSQICDPTVQLHWEALEAPAFIRHFQHTGKQVERKLHSAGENAGKCWSKPAHVFYFIRTFASHHRMPRKAPCSTCVALHLWVAGLMITIKCVCPAIPHLNSRSRKPFVELLGFWRRFLKLKMTRACLWARCLFGVHDSIVDNLNILAWIRTRLFHELTSCGFHDNHLMIHVFESYVYALYALRFIV